MKVISSGVVAGIAAAALVSITPSAHAAVTQTEMIRQGQFVSALGDTRTAGHVEFLPYGLHVWTDGATDTGPRTDGGTGTWNTDKAAEYVAVATQPLPGSASLTWYGTSPQPGAQLVFDADGDASTTADGYNVLIGERIYGDDFWMSTSSSIYKNHHELCPETTGGSGSDCHGTLAEWQQNLPHAEMYAAGFSLGSGVKGDGVIRDIQVGDTDYEFTSEPPVTKVPVTGTATANEVVRPRVTTLALAFATNALGANQSAGKQLTFKVTDNGALVFRDTMGPAEKSSVKFAFAKGSGKHKVQILKNGVVDRTFKINMGR
jgi:hypothetical protein